MSEETYYRRNRDTILNRAKDYIRNKKEVLGKKAKKYRALYEKVKNYKERTWTKQVSKIV